MQNIPPGFRQSRRAFTMIETLSIVVIAAILVSILVVAIENFRNAGARAQCLSRLKNISAAIALYCSDNNGAFPTSGASGNRWPYKLGRMDYGFGDRYQTFIVGTGDSSEGRTQYCREFKCPTVENTTATVAGVYGYHEDLGRSSVRLASLRQPSRLPLLACNQGSGGAGHVLVKNRLSEKARDFGYSGPTDKNGASPNHGRICNVLFADGHCEGIDATRGDIFPWNDPDAFIP